MILGQPEDGFRRHARERFDVQVEVLTTMLVPILRQLWDQYDGTNDPEGFAGKAIHLALNLLGDGRYCAV